VNRGVRREREGGKEEGHELIADAVQVGRAENEKAHRHVFR